MQRLPIELRLDGSDDFRVAVAYVKNAEAAKAIDVFAALDVPVTVGSGVTPFDDGARAVDLCCFSIFQKSGVDVIAKVFNRFAGDPRRLFGGDLRALN